MLKDLRHACRLLLKHKGLTTAAVVAVALGIGANAAVFSTVDAMLLRPLPLEDLDRLVDLSESRPRRGDIKLSVSPANFLDWRSQAQSYESVAAMAWWDVNLTGGGDPERVQGFQVSASFFRTLGVTPSVGRAFEDDEEKAGRDKVVVLSDHLWQRRFGGDPSILQRTIQLDSIPYTIIGVAPAGFNFPMTNDLWAPLAFDAETAANRGSRYLTVVGRLKPSVTVDAADAELQLIAAQLEKQFPHTNTGQSADVVPLVEGVQRAIGRPEAVAPIVRQELAAVDPQQPVFRVRSMERVIADSSIGLSYIWVMMTIFGFIALILAAVGVYAVMAYGVTQRPHEFGVRLALGARASNVLGLVVRQALMLSGIGLAIGLLGAYGVGKVLASNLFGVVAMDVSTFVLVAAGLTVIAMFAGYLPARRATSVDPVIALRHE